MSGRKYVKGNDGVLRIVETGRPACLVCGARLAKPRAHFSTYGDYLSGGYFCTQRCAVEYARDKAKEAGWVGASIETEAARAAIAKAEGGGDER